MASVAAVDLGASSGRVIVADVSADGVTLTPVARFANEPVRTPDGLQWDVLGLYREILDGLSAAGRHASALASIGVDSWAVDYGLLRDGRLLGSVLHYRDERNAPAAAAVHERLTPSALYAINGLQYLPFNTLYQLEAEKQRFLELADTLLLVPDLLTYWLSGAVGAERTNASTTGLLDVRTGAWSVELTTLLGLREGLLPPLVAPGTVVGALRAEAAERVGRAVPVTAVGSHDTASAVVAVPATRPDFAYISCGTWGLVGVELNRPVLTEDSRLAGFTNEGGLDGTIRFLHNVMGLWLLSESVRTWERAGESVDLPALLRTAAALPGPVAVFDPNDERFAAPGDLPARIAAVCRERGARVPETPAEFARAIVESLAQAFADAVARAEALSGHRVSVIHLVGGGAQNELLCQLTADRSGRPVLAGPVEATALGNVLVQARAAGIVDGDLPALRALVARAFPPVEYQPR